jgi:hypothetical protein
MPWEDQYGYAQAVKVDDTIYVLGQLSHDDQGNMVGAAPLDHQRQNPRPLEYGDPDAPSLRECNDDSQ